MILPQIKDREAAQVADLRSHPRQLVPVQMQFFKSGQATYFRRQRIDLVARKENLRQRDQIANLRWQF